MKDIHTPGRSASMGSPKYKEMKTVGRSVGFRDTKVVENLLRFFQKKTLFITS